MSAPKIQMNLKAMLVTCPEGGFTSFCPQIKGAISQGETEEEALANLVEAIEGLMEVNAEISAEMAETCQASFGGASSVASQKEYELAVA